ncbi:hypothetical protein THASP1DRAFT_25590 [Thamnocephalis sphaerospora]|uniref:Uncharacterized protein n=1 Tax=Thamnocephalis sphaerospora TaxID=78915 RepID=A0A4V1IW18_9FUNG|nr:hypothetical protein THASP1DRAFT_25590 [Thamnocephalis sphaerospora]|eukprot:RKP06009.1 hypothetical protein THASP1DRAFT_25590 [Thamnocephalis sphaerospora]
MANIPGLDALARLMHTGEPRGLFYLRLFFLVMLTTFSVIYALLQLIRCAAPADVYHVRRKAQPVTLPIVLLVGPRGPLEAGTMRAFAKVQTRSGDYDMDLSGRMKRVRFGPDLLQTSNQTDAFQAQRNDELAAWVLVPDPIWRLVMPGAGGEGAAELTRLRIGVQYNGRGGPNDAELQGLSAPYVYLLPAGSSVGSATGGEPANLDVLTSNGAPIEWRRTAQAWFQESYHINNGWVVGDGSETPQRRYAVSVMTTPTVPGALPGAAAGSAPLLDVMVAPLNVPSQDGRLFTVETHVQQPNFSWLDVIGSVGGTMALALILYTALFGSRRLRPWGFVHLIFRRQLLAKVSRDVATASAAPTLAPPMILRAPALDTPSLDAHSGGKQGTEGGASAAEFQRLQRRINDQQAEVAHLRELAAAFAAFQRRMDTFYLRHDLFYADPSDNRTNAKVTAMRSQIAPLNRDDDKDASTLVLPRPPALTRASDRFSGTTHQPSPHTQVSSPGSPAFDVHHDVNETVAGPDFGINHYHAKPRHKVKKVDRKDAQFWPQDVRDTLAVPNTAKSGMLSPTDILNDHLNYGESEPRMPETPATVAPGQSRPVTLLEVEVALPNTLPLAGQQPTRKHGWQEAFPPSLARKALDAAAAVAAASSTAHVAASGAPGTAAAATTVAADNNPPSVAPKAANQAGSRLASRPKLRDSKESWA